jgi:hypothetical protein
VKIGRINKVKKIFIENVWGKSLVGKAYMPIPTNSKSKYVPTKEEKSAMIK